MNAGRLLGILLGCALVIGGAVALTACGENGPRAETRKGNDISPPDPGKFTGNRVCEPLPGLDADELQLFARAAQRLSPRPRATIGWSLVADSEDDKDQLVRSLRAAGFDVDAGQFDGGAWGLRASRPSSLKLSALEREKHALLQAAHARSKRMTLTVAYPVSGCEDDTVDVPGPG